MSGLKRPCVDCGELTDTGPYCTEHRPAVEDTRPSASRRGYDYQWQKLSKRARAAQPFCTVCNTTEDLTVDHTPEAWRRVEAGKPIRFQDVVVLCRAHNSEAGAARGEASRPE